ncbi:MAG: nickel pincer cofactor biosynthesis protein LarC [Nitrospinae bacterium]|nr:nickel pincer cofactor biosynthesis protein LarC [Nitrospinota bacterium]
MRTAYFDAFSGISGDMTVGALLDAGASLARLRRELKKLDVAGYTVSVEKLSVNGIHSTRFNVRVGQKQKYRDYSAIRKIIGKSRLNPKVKENALAIFKKIGEAEAVVHNRPLDEVHFHEVGAVDSIVDVVGAAICLDQLGVTRCECSPIPTGRGFVDTMHGIMPVPAPATMLILKGAPIAPDGAELELTTPTGAAIAAALCVRFGPAPSMTPRTVGYGAGSKTRADGVPNLLRVVIGEKNVPGRTLAVLETNLDDATPESVSYAVQKALSSGALDAWVAPITMKKGRQAFCLSILCETPDAARLRDVMFEETPSLGLRQYDVQRFELPRKIISVKTRFGTVRVKVAVTPSGQERRKPEFEDCRALAEKTGASLEAVHRAALAAALKEKG